MAAISSPPGMTTARFVPDTMFLARFDARGPRYTSYPNANRYTEAYDSAHYLNALHHRALGGPLRPLSLFVHIPECRFLCYCSACNKPLSRDASHGDRYLHAVLAEAKMVRTALTSATPVAQLHLDGDVAACFNDNQLQQLIEGLAATFTFSDNVVKSLGLDPFTVDAGRLAALRELGFHRISFGTAASGGHLRPTDDAPHTLDMLHAARRLGFDSIRIELAYGVPGQNPDDFTQTIEALAEPAPDHVLLYDFASLPVRFEPKRAQAAAELPEVDARVSMLHAALTSLCAQGWDYIGMDHFARHDNPLAIAKREGRLHRNFQGYTVQPDCDVVGLGTTAISRVGTQYARNLRSIDEYHAAVENGYLPVLSGHAMSSDDLVRYAVIMAILCQGEVRFDDTGEDHLIDFRHYFRHELIELAALAEHGLVRMDAAGFSVTQTGGFALHAIAGVFDRYARQSQALTRFSRIL